MVEPQALEAEMMLIDEMTCTAERSGVAEADSHRGPPDKAGTHMMTMSRSVVVEHQPKEAIFVAGDWIRIVEKLLPKVAAAAAAVELVRVIGPPAFFVLRPLKLERFEYSSGGDKERFLYQLQIRGIMRRRYFLLLRIPKPVRMVSRLLLNTLYQF